MPTKILVVDDKISVQHLLRDYLEENGFAVEVASNGREAMYAARHAQPDLILLDVMMPEMDGLEFMRQHRRDHDTPIILLTARVEETDKIVGLELGADDYVTKPFSMAELVARIKAVLRRGQRAPAETLRVGNLTLDKAAHTVTLGNQPVEVTPTEFDLLTLFMSNPGRAFSRADLLEHLQGHAFEGVERTMDVHVRNLRTKIEDDPSQPRYIETVYGIGYRMNRVEG